ncbi:MAG: helix-turn-helix transcriptional regulator [Dehalococcoidales bacterium]|nr:helix-turn-helix transcriptional regulator [Dehalococcoidales bacterium]
MVRVELKREVVEKNLIRQNCSKKELADRIGVSRSYLSAICHGRVEPSAAMRQRFLEYFNCSFDDLFVIREGEPCRAI